MCGNKKKFSKDSYKTYPGQTVHLLFDGGSNNNNNSF